jgi:integrase
LKGSITKRGRDTWRLRFDVGQHPDGRRKVASITVKGNRRQAEAERRKRLGSVDDGTYVERSKVTVAEFVRERVKHWHKAGKITLRTRERYDDLVDHQIVRFLGEKVVQRLSTLDIEQWHVTLHNEGAAHGGGLTAGTIRSAHGILKKALAEGVKHGLLTRNVCSGDDGEKAPKAKSSEVEIIDAKQIADVVAKLRGRSIFAKVVISLFTGLRRGEVLALRLGSVDFATKILKVREAVEQTRSEGLRLKPPKTAAGSRDLVMPDIVVEALGEVRRELLERHMALGLGRPTDKTLLFSRIFDGGLQSPSQYSSDWREAVLALGLPNVRLHSLRHTHASMLVDAGVDIVRISKRLGHKDAAVTLRIYGHLFRKRDDASADAINLALSSIGKPS